MLETYQKSFFILLSLIFLTPLFFVPGGALYIDNAKSVLFLAGLILSVIVFSFEFWKHGVLKFPKHHFILIVVALPIVYALSALLSTPASLSLFGYGFEVGTFGHLLLCSSLLLLASSIFSDTSRVLQGLTAFFISFTILAIFAAIKILVGGDFLALGNFFGNMGNPLGSWTDLAVAFGLLAVFSALAIGMIPMRWAVKAILYGAFSLSLALLALLNFHAALILTLAGGVVMLGYFLSVEKHFLYARGGKVGSSLLTGTVYLPALLIIITAVFVINPAVGGGKTLNQVAAEKFGIENVEVRPSVSATFDITKAVLSQNGLLGSGPNSFGRGWLMHKPANVNTTPFWALTFPFGVGFVPTQVASVGILGSLLWFAFFGGLVVLAIKALRHIPESRASRFVVVSSLFSTFFLWAASFIYVPSGTMTFLTFFFTGLFVASLSHTSIIPSRIINRSPTYILMLTVLCIGALALGWVGFNKVSAVYHWREANDLINSSGVNVQSVENELLKAVEASPADIYYLALSKLNFLQAQAAANATSSPQENLTAFDDALSKSVESAKLAVTLNPAGYANWVMLGSIYSALTAPPLSVEGAYENSRFAYGEALKRNPLNPETYLLLAKLEMNNGNLAAARPFLETALVLKSDYAEARQALESFKQ